MTIARGQSCRKCGADNWYHMKRPSETERQGPHFRCAECVKAKSRGRKYNPQVKRAWRARHRDEIRKRWREWYAKNPGGAAEKRWALRGIRFTWAEYEAMLAAQGGKCAVCRRDCKSRKRLALDHDHETGEVRALLCATCNMLAQDPDRVRAVLVYMETHARGRRL